MDINASCLPTQKVPCYLLVLRVRIVHTDACIVTTGIITKAARHAFQNKTSTQQQPNASLLDVQEEAHLSGHQGSWDDPAIKKRGEAERHISFQHEAVKQVEAPGHGLSPCRKTGKPGASSG